MQPGIVAASLVLGLWVSIKLDGDGGVGGATVPPSLPSSRFVSVCRGRRARPARRQPRSRAPIGEEHGSPSQSTGGGPAAARVRAGRSEARSRPLGPHVTRRRGRAPHPRTKRRGRAPGCGEDPRLGPGRGAQRDWVAPRVALDALRPDEGDGVGRNGSELHLRPGDHRRPDSSNARQNRATRPSFPPCVVWPFKGSVPPSLAWALLCKASWLDPKPQTIEGGNKGGPAIGWVGPGAPWLHCR